MTDISGSGFDERNCSYQHIQGTMLLNLNKVASVLHLSHNEYRLMGMLIGLWNKNYNKAFPTVDYLAKYCRMSKATILKCMSRLVDLNLLVVVKTKGKRNNYYFSKQLLDSSKSSTRKLHAGFTCKTTHDKKPMKKKTYQNISDKTNDDSKNTNITNIREYMKLLSKLRSWGYMDAKILISKFGVDQVKEFIKQVEAKKPKNPGAYLRSMALSIDAQKNMQYSECSKKREETQIEKMLKHKYWKHVPSGKILQAKPDLGEHLLIKYFKQENMVTFFETGLTDILDNFEPQKSDS